MFRRSNQYQRAIDLVDKLGNTISEVLEGRMNITSHDAVLASLEQRAKQYRCYGKVGKIGNHNVLATVAFDKIGTVDASHWLQNGSKTNEQFALIEQQERNRVRDLGISDEIFRIHGIPPSSKGDGIVQLVYENVNGLSNNLSNNKRLKEQKRYMTS
jgi:hypothetical protein